MRYRKCAAGGNGVTGSVVGLPRGPFLGREEERALLEGLVAGVAGGRGGVVWVEGEPGVGKSTLLTAGLAGAQDLGCQLAWGGR